MAANHMLKPVEVTDEMQEIAHGAMRHAARDGALGQVITVAQAQAIEEAIGFSIAVVLAQRGLEIKAAL